MSNLTFSADPPKANASMNATLQYKTISDAPLSIHTIYRPNMEPTLSDRRSELIKAKLLLQSIDSPTDLQADGLIIPPPAEIIQSFIQQTLINHQDSAISDLISDPRISNPCTDTSTFLKSYKQAFLSNRDLRDRMCHSQKNVFAPQFFSQVPINPLLPDTLLVKFSVYHPVTSKKTQQWVIPSSMPVKELLSNIDCLSELVSFNKKNTHKLFIDKAVTDMSAPVDSLRIQIGRDYYLTHRQSCVHRFKATEAYLITQNDIKEKTLYPLRTFKSKTRKRKCEVCRFFYAKFVCLHARLIDRSVCYICETCLDGLFPDKKMDFAVYQYFYD